MRPQVSEPKNAFLDLQAEIDALYCLTVFDTTAVFKCNFAIVTCRRKRGEKGEVVETVGDVIVRRLTAERIHELKKLIKETQEKHRYKWIAFNNTNV